MNRSLCLTALAIIAAVFPTGAHADRDIALDGVDTVLSGGAREWDNTSLWLDTTSAPFDLGSISITNNNASGTDGYLFVLIVFNTLAGNKDFAFEIILPGDVIATIGWNTKTTTVTRSWGSDPRTLTDAQMAFGPKNMSLELAIPYAELNSISPSFSYGSDAITFLATTDVGGSTRDTLTGTYDGRLDPAPSKAALWEAFSRPERFGMAVGWRTVFETSNLAFRVEREDRGAWTDVALVPGRLDSPGDYEIFDAQGSKGDRYRIVDIDSRGIETPHEVSAFWALPHRRDVRKRKTGAASAARAPAGSLAGTALAEVKAEGLVKLIAGDLAGFGLAASRTRIIGPDGPVPSFIEGDDAYFWAPPPRRGYDGLATYQLVAAPPVKPRSMVAFGRVGSAPTSVRVNQRFEEDRFRWTGASTEATFVWATAIDRFYPASVILPVVAPADASATLTVALEGGTSYSAVPDHIAEIALNGTFLGTVSFDGYDAGRFELSVPAGLLEEGANILTVTAQRIPGVSYNAVYLDWAELSYQRQVSVPGYVANLRGGTNLKVAGPGVRVLDVTSPFDPQELRPAGRMGIVVPGNRFRRIAVVRLGDAQPARLRALPKPLAPVTGADYLVVYAPGFESAAARLTSARARQGLRTAGFPMDSVELAYAGGARGPEALRALFQEMGSWRPVPRAVVLLGAASQDPRDITRSGHQDLVPTSMVRTLLGLWADSDLALAAAPGEPLPPFAIGRIPARDPDEALTLVEKILAGERQRPLGRKLSVVEDTGREAVEFLSLADSLAAEVPGVATVRLSASDGRQQISTSLGEGIDSLFFAGHGQPLGWANQSIWSADDALAARNAHLPVVYSFTCYDGMFAYPNATALSAGMLLSPGGARAVFSPSSALSPVQHRFLLEALVAQQHASTLGERLQRVREVLLSAGAGAAELVYIYNLLGDPMSRAD